MIQYRMANGQWTMTNDQWPMAQYTYTYVHTYNKDLTEPIHNSIVCKSNEM